MSLKCIRCDPNVPVLQTGRKEGNVLSNDALNTFYLRLNSVGRKVKDQSVRLAAMVLLYMFHFICRNIGHTIAFVTLVVEHWLERSDLIKIKYFVHPFCLSVSAIKFAVI